MKVRSLKFGIVLAGFALTATPALAQNPKVGDPGSGASSGARSNPGGGGETAVSRGGGGGGAVSNAGGGVSSSSESSSPSSVSSSSPDTSFGSFRGLRESAPAHRYSDNGAQRTHTASASDGQKAAPRSSGSSQGSSGGEHAAPRGSAASGGSSATRTNSGSRNPSRATGASEHTGANNASGTNEVPTWSRPRGDHPVTGSAVPRTGPRPDHNGSYYGGGYYYDPYYYGSYYGYAYSPYYVPYGFGLGYGLYSGLGWNPYFGDPFGDPYYGGYGGYSSSQYYEQQGHLKLKVKPRTAKVYVDGYFVGPVDSFDGAFQKLALNGGRHKVEIKADGYETAEFDVLITPDQTVTFQGELKRIQ